MKKITRKMLKGSFMALFVTALSSGPSLAATHDLCATDGAVTMPDGAAIPVWTFVDTDGGPCVQGLANALPGPELRTPVGEALTVNLTNSLTVPVSFFVPGLRADTVTGGDGLLTSEAAAGGGVATYTFNSPRPGTFLYYSGTDITTQVPMGLHGALVVDQGTGQAYVDVAYDQDHVLVYSEIDPNLNGDPATFGGARVINWNPRYFMINGQAHPATGDIGINTSEDVLLRFVNAGLRTFVPTLDGGLYMELKAEDGHRYPQPLQQYGIELQAGKTVDVLVNAGFDGSYALYDRAASYDSGVTNIIAGAIAGAPTAVDDPDSGSLSAYTIVEGGSLTTVAGGAPAGVLDNDSDPTNDPLTAILVSDVSSGALTLNSDGSFSYIPDTDFNGSDTFTYVANDGVLNSNVATATITVDPVNDPPTAVVDYYTAPEGQSLNIEAPGVLENDSDIDGDALYVGSVNGNSADVGVETPLSGTATLTLNADGSFEYNSTGTAGAVDTFTYEACDSGPLCSTALVTVTVGPPAENTLPFANDDYDETTKNSGGITFSVTGNDVDPDGSIDVATVVLTTGTGTQRGGTVQNNGDGTVTYTPKRGFRGTDTFKYTVNDNAGATSNEATVRINVK